MYLYPMTEEAMKEVGQNVADRISAYVKESQAYLFEHMPFVEDKSGREKLAFYRTTDAAYWENLARTNRDYAKAKILEWAALVRRYGQP